MKKKGFTLIELLAVIIILSVVAVITTPIVLSSISKAKEEARKDSVLSYAEAIKLSYTEEIIKGSDKTLEELANSKMQGEKVSCELIKYDDVRYGSLLYNCTVGNEGNYCYINGNVYEIDSPECSNVYNIINGQLPYKKPIISILSKNPDNTEYSQSKNIKIEYPASNLDIEHYYIKSNKSININNIISSCEKDGLPYNCTSVSSTLVEANRWYEVSGNVELNINENITINAIAGNNGDFGELLTYQEEKIDTTAPTTSIKNIVTTIDTAIVYDICQDSESGIIKKEYSINNGTYQESNIFENLTTNETYNFKVKCTNGSGMSVEVEGSAKTGLKELKAPTIIQTSQTPENSEYATERVITITYYNDNATNPKYYYSLDGNNWIEATTETYDVTFTNNGYLYAKIVDNNDNVATASTYTVDNIDSSKPNVEISLENIKTDRITVTGNCSDTESKITKYEFSNDGGTTWTTYTSTETSYSHTFTNLIQTKDYTFVVRCTNGSGLTEIDSEVGKTGTIVNPTITQYSQIPENNEYATSRVIRITFDGTGVENPVYQYSLDGNDWITITTTTHDETFTSNGYLYARTMDVKGNIANASTYTVDNIDNSKPNVEIKVGTIKTDRITVTGLCSDTESKITKYEFSNDGGTTWTTYTSTETSYSHTFTNLYQTKDYTFAVRCTNGSGLTEIDNEVGRTSTIENPTISQYSQTPENSTYAQKRVIRITFIGTNIENPIYQYSLNGTNWLTVTNETYDVTFTNNGYLYARTTDSKGNIANASTYTVDNIDSTAPSAGISSIITTTNTATITGSCEDLESEISKTEYSKDGTTWQTSNVISNLTQGTNYTFRIRCTNGSGLTTTTSQAATTKQTYTIAYNMNGATGNIESTTKVQDETTNITNVVPTRTGYQFLGWGTSATDTTVDYASNATYTSNSSTTLFAIWKKTITITYNGNGATGGSTASQECTMYNLATTCSIKLNASGFTKTGYNFTGWGTGTVNKLYDASTSYNFKDSTTLYAIWEFVEWPTVVDTNPGVICGTGTTEDYSSNTVCNINSIEDLVAFSNLVNAKNYFSGKTVNLNVNLDFKNTNSYVNSSTTAFGDINGNGTTETLLVELTTSSGFKPIGVGGSAYAFSGTFNGNGYKIGNLLINRTSTNYIGLFGYNRGTIKGITLENVTINGKRYVGGIVGQNTGGTITGSQVLNGNITSTSYYIGGIAAYNTGTINEVIYRGNITTSSYGAGGIAGYNSSIISNAIAGGTIKTTYTSDGYIGGMVGQQAGDSANTTGIFESGSVQGSYLIGKAVGSLSSGNYTIYVSNSVSISGSIWSYDDTDASTAGTSIASNNIGDINAYETLGIDTFIGGDNDSSGYYFDYDSEGNIIIKDTTNYPMTVSLTGAGTSANPYKITSVNDWKQASLIAKTSGIYFEITNNITFGTKQFYMLGSNNNRMASNLNGNNKTLSGIVVNGHTYVGGISGYTTGTIENIVLNAPSVSNSGNYTGGISGYSTNLIQNISMTKPVIVGTGIYTGGVTGDATSTIKNITITTPTINGTGNHVGGISGNSTSGSTIEKVVITSPIITGSNYYVGGISGYNRGTIKGITLENVTINGKRNVGGVVGYNAAGTITGSQVLNGNITSTSHYIGGIAAYNTGTIKEVIYRGNITTSSDNVGGISGYNTGIISNAIVSGTIKTTYTNDGYVGGIVGYQSGDSSSTTGIFESGSVQGSYLIGKAIGSLASGNYKIYVSSSVSISGSIWSYYDTDASTAGTSMASSNVGNLTYYNSIIGLPITASQSTSGYYFTKDSSGNVIIAP